MSRSSLTVDSSIWIEILTQGPREKKCTKEINESREVFVPTLVIFEVYRKICRATSDDQALSATAYLNRYHVLDLSVQVALAAGDLSIEHKLPMADAIVLAHARDADSLLLTLDNDFAEIPGVLILR